MIIAKEYMTFSPKNMQQKIFKDNYDWAVVNVNKNVYITKRIKKKYIFYKNTLNKNIIIHLNYNYKYNKTKYIMHLYKKCSSIKINYLSIPFYVNNDIYDYYSIYTLFIQKLNSILLSIDSTTGILIENINTSLAAMAFIIENSNYINKIYLNVNLDILEDRVKNFNYILDDIVKYNLKYKIKLLKTNRYTKKDKKIIKLLSYLSKDVILYGERI